MNKLTKLAASTLLALTLLTPGLAAADDMKAMVDYSKVDIMKKDNMDIVPLRQLAETLGFNVTWNGMDRSITLTLGSMTGDTMDSSMMSDKNKDDKKMDGDMKSTTYSITIKIDSKNAMVDMKDSMLTFAPIIINNKTYVSKDFIEMYLANQMMMK
jgi:hypothetical protein